MRRAYGVVLGLVACGPQVPVDAGGTTGSADETASSASPTVASVADESGGEDDVVPDYDLPPSGDDGCGDADEDPCLLDILVVVDNSATMADPQIALTRALVQLVGRLENGDGATSVIVDVQMMFTTSDMGNPICAPFEPPGYDPARGAPTATGCNARIADFTATGSPPDVREDVCSSACPSDVAASDRFVAFHLDQDDNVPDVVDVDVDGDGVPDSPAAQAVACMAPQGINGCGYEQPLEAMAQALDPDAPWNASERPFLREDSIVLILVVSDETDCSMDDFSVMDDMIYWEWDPQTWMKSRTSAICWNAGVTCVGPDVDGVHHDCTSTDGPLLPVSRYTDLLVGRLRELEGHEVLMIAITGVPIVTEVSEFPPFEPVEGGIEDLVIHEWRDGVYPRGDMLPDDASEGVDAADKNFELGIGPGCTELDGPSGASVQGIPSPRVHEVCAALDVGTEYRNGVRCCVESVCDSAPDLSCVDGWFTSLGDLGPWG